MENTIRKKGLLLSALVIGVLLITLGSFIYSSYSVYRETIVGQQQEQLLAISKSLIRSLQMYLSEEAHKLAMIEENNPLYKQLLVELPEDGQEKYQHNIAPYYQHCNLLGLYMVDAQGDLQFESTLSGKKEQYLQEENKFYKDYLSLKDNIGEVYRSEKDGFIIPITHHIYNQGEYLGALVGIISLEDMYNKLIATNKVGEQGYVMVKDYDGMIIMHPVKEQIGIKMVEDRKKEFPEFDFSDLEELEANQYTKEEGMAEYYSYWWTQDKPMKVKKISSFSRVDLGDSFWVLSVVMDYSEIVGPIRNNLIRLLSLGVTVTLMIILAALGFVRLRKRHKDLIMETRYLKKMNYTLKELQESEKKVMHYQKLQTIDTLTGGIAHEVNNLLTPILGYSQLAVQAMPKEHEYYEDMEEIYQAALRSKDLMKQISLLSRKEKTEGNHRIIDVSEEILKGIKMVKIAKGCTVKIIKQIEGDSGYIQGSRTHIQQILINLCNNACQSMNEEGGTVTVKLEKVENTKNRKKYACLTIEDTGCGMNEDLLKRIFDPFFTTKPVGEGTGIGLSVVQSIVESYKGHISVESEEGEGSRFKVFLPILESKPVPTKLKNEKYILGEKLRVLVVEDNVQIAKLMKKTLAKMGYGVTIQTDSLRALDLFKKNPIAYNLLITDYSMPNLTGAKLAREIKEIRPDIKIILMTGLVEKEVANQIKNNLIDDFIIKPIEYNELSKKIYKLFSTEKE